MTQEKLSKMIVMLFESKLKSYRQVTVDTWVEILEIKNLPDDKLESAFTKMIYGDDEFPSVGKIVKACQPDYKQIAEDEWVKVMIQVGRGEFKFSGITKDVLNEIGGSMLLGNIHPMEKLEKRKQFIKKYEKEMETPLMLEGK